MSPRSKASYVSSAHVASMRRAPGASFCWKFVRGRTTIFRGAKWSTWYPTPVPGVLGVIEVSVEKYGIAPLLDRIYALCAPVISELLGGLLHIPPAVTRPRSVSTQRWAAWARSCHSTAEIAVRHGCPSVSLRSPCVPLARPRGCRWCVRHVPRSAASCSAPVSL